MSDDLFLRPCGYRRKRRSLLLDVLALVAFAALTGWLWHCVRHAASVPVMMRTGVSALPSGSCLLAMAPVPDFAIGAAIAALGFLFAVAVGFGVKRLFAYDAEAALRWEAKPIDERQAEHLASVAPCDDPLSMPALGLYQGLDAEDVGRIVRALLAECCEVEELVRKADTDCAVEDYADRLAGARRRLKGVRFCLSGLVKRFPVAEFESGSALQKICSTTGRVVEWVLVSAARKTKRELSNPNGGVIE